jgi:hypothetical protein
VFVLADDLARTAGLPPALTALGVESSQVLSQAEASRVRGQAVSEGSILERMALIEQRAIDLDVAAGEIKQRATVVELSDQIFSFNGYLFGDGVLINKNTGSGAIFDFEGSSLLLLSDLKGEYSVTRTAEGVFLLLGNLP